MNRLIRLMPGARSNVVRNFVVGRKAKGFRIDRTGLVQMDEAEETTSHSPAVIPKEKISPLGKDLQSFIKLKGPISLHDYMSQTLNHLLHGYYQGKNEVIGEDGDFITAPEISQLFGEMVGIWSLSVWEQMGKPSKIHLIEMGPGKGTLMKDLMRVAAKFGGFADAVHVHFVELSAVLRGRQFDALGCTNNSSSSDNSSNKNSNNITNDTETVGVDKKGVNNSVHIQDGVAYKMSNGISVHWHSFLHQVPSDAPSIIIGQEFLDAFPVHQFCYTDRGWREKLVDLNSNSKSKSSSSLKHQQSHSEGLVGGTGATISDTLSADEEGGGDTPYHFRFVMSPNATAAVRSLLISTPGSGSGSRLSRTQSSSASSSIAGDNLNNNTATTPAATPTTPSAPAIAQISMMARAAAKPKIGDGVEISPLAIATCEDVAARVVRCGGAALFIDYGQDFTQADTLRAYMKHKQVSVLSQPGLVDMTADVDFSMCRRAAEQKGAMVPPLLTQGDFLMRMGIVSRAEQLINLDETSEEQATALLESLKYLVDPAKMGERFKVLCIANPVLGQVTAFDPAEVAAVTPPSGASTSASTDSASCVDSAVSPAATSI